MKFIFALCLVVLVAGAYAGELTEAQRQYYVKWVEECVKETGVSMDVVHEIRAGNWAHVDDKTKCYCKCTQDKANFLIGEKLNEVVIKEIMTPLFGKELINAACAKCRSVTGTNPCDTSLKLYQCFYASGVKPKLS